MISRRPDPGIAKVVWILFVLLFSLAPASAQLTTSLVQFTNLWKYDDSGAELGNAWRTNDFNDSTWPEGQGLLGFEDNTTPYLVHAPLGTSIFPSTTTTSFYFRARFNFSGPTAGLVLVSSNLVDDGCVLY